jgi:hypothetical protein
VEEAASVHAPKTKGNSPMSVMSGTGQRCSMEVSSKWEALPWVIVAWLRVWHFANRHAVVAVDDDPLLERHLCVEL